MPTIHGAQRIIREEGDFGSITETVGQGVPSKRTMRPGFYDAHIVDSGDVSPEQIQDSKKKAFTRAFKAAKRLG